MVILKKIKSATLIETLIATILIIVIFLIASLVINNLFFNTFHQKKEIAITRLNELEYKYLNNDIKLPMEEEIENWKISVTEEKDKHTYILFVATHSITKKEIRRTLIKNEY
ncbi:conserved hypothetical protein [Flavobacterium sp. 9AF]|uniref:hypothetical protein n=1 Tax=Flavobacterium sp. 9AF TaxID=2653142 RepID=UPI0012F27940|nr:hypothetical protein [Flavobacterium sp. 9AF]VXB36673.1 conserved hypothetical protein [Flavobacterium sp. 9AF]